MTTTARTMTRRIATDSRNLVGLVVAGLFDSEFETCELCGHASAELFSRTDNRDGSEIEVCEDCANHADVSCSDHIDA